MNLVKVTRGHPAGPEAPTLACCAPHTWACLTAVVHPSCGVWPPLGAQAGPGSSSGPVYRFHALIPLWFQSVCYLPSSSIFLVFPRTAGPKESLIELGEERARRASHTPMFGPFSYSAQIYGRVILNFHSLSTAQHMV